MNFQMDVKIYARIAALFLYLLQVSDCLRHHGNQKGLDSKHHTHKYSHHHPGKKISSVLSPGVHRSVDSHLIDILQLQEHRDNPSSALADDSPKTKIESDAKKIMKLGSPEILKTTKQDQPWKNDEPEFKPQEVIDITTNSSLGNDTEPQEEEAPPAKRCPTCGSQGLSEEAVKALKLSMFTNVLRQKLRMPELPEMEEATVPKSGTPSLPNDLLQKFLHNDTTVEDPDAFYAIDDELIIPGENMSSLCQNHVTGCYLFNLSSKVSSDIASAYLWFNSSQEVRSKFRPLQYIIYDVDILSKQLSKRRINVNEIRNRNSWVTMNLTMSINKWLREGAKSKLLAIVCRNCATSHKGVDQEGHIDYKPVLEMKYFKNKSVKRSKKNADCDPRTECCKRPLEVNFNVINMLNIVNPSTLNVDFCYGHCDGMDQYAFNHTALKQRLRWVHNTEPSLRDQLKPCCVPLILKDASVLVREQNNLFTAKILPKVIVEKCGCL